MLKHSRVHIREQARKHRERRRRIMAHWWGGRGVSEYWIVRTKDRKKCSCFFCCNPRRRGEGDPIATVKQDLSVALE